MTLSLLIGLSTLLAAMSLGALERVMRPDMKRFLCVGPRILTILQVTTITLAFASFDRLYREPALDWLFADLDVVRLEPLIGTPFQLAASGMIAATFTSFLVLVLRLRLNEGVWPRLQARLMTVRKANSIGGLAGAVLAKQAAGSPVIPVGEPIGVPSDMPEGLVGAMDKLAQVD